MNTLATIRRPLALLALPLVLAFSAPSAQAQKLSIGFGKHGHHGSINVSAGIRFGAPACNPPIYCAPVHCAPQPVWVPGHYQNVERRVYVPGCTRQVYVPALYQDRVFRDYCGNTHVERVMTCPATWQTVQDPGRWECVNERVWIEGGWTRVAY
ncbi:MAG: hypothetical protein ABI054_02400 [Planctomycetota bacterium]